MRSETTPDKVVTSSGSEAPNAPPRSLTPPPDEPDRTAVPDQDQAPHPPLPSIAIHLDDLPSPPPKRRRAPPAAAPVGGGGPQPRARPSPDSQLYIPNAEIKQGLRDYSDIVFTSEKERTIVSLSRDQKQAKASQIQDIEKFVFKPGSNVPSYLLATALESGNLGGPIVPFAPPHLAHRNLPRPAFSEQMARLWTIAGTEIPEAQRRLEDVQAENPWAEATLGMETLDLGPDHALHLVPLDDQQLPPPEDQPLPEERQDETIVAGMMGERERGESEVGEGGRGRESTLVDVGGTGVGRVSMIPGTTGNWSSEDLERALADGSITRDQAEEYLAQLKTAGEAFYPPASPVETHRLEVAELREAIEVATEELSSDQVLTFHNLCPAPTTQAIVAAKTFGVLLGTIWFLQSAIGRNNKVAELLKAQKVECEQEMGTFGPIEIQLRN